VVLGLFYSIDWKTYAQKQDFVARSPKMRMRLWIFLCWIPNLGSGILFLVFFITFSVLKHRDGGWRLSVAPQQILSLFDVWNVVNRAKILLSPAVVNGNEQNATTSTLQWMVPLSMTSLYGKSRTVCTPPPPPLEQELLKKIMIDPRDLWEYFEITLRISLPTGPSLNQALLYCYLLKSDPFL
jgi:hypothetical protein